MATTTIGPTTGPAPKDANGNPPVQGYVAGTGVLPVLLGAPQTDTLGYQAAPIKIAAPDALTGHVILDANTVPTYACAYVGLTPAAACTDLAILNGGAGKVIRVMRVVISALVSAATGATLDLRLIKRSTADSAGTPVTVVTPVSFDSADAAAAAALTAYSANPTLGTTVGDLYVAKFQQTLGTATATDFPTNQPFMAQWGITDSKPIVLRGAAEGLAINFNGATLAAGASVDVLVEWTEFAS